MSMKYNDLETSFKHFINGKISQFMDSYIRQHKVWTPDQMHSAFLELVNDEILNSYYTIHYKDGVEIWNSKIPVKWLITSEGRKLVLERFRKKYEKDKPIANRKSPLVERVRFGYRW